MALGGRGVKDGLATPVYSISEEEKELRDVKAGLATPVWVINPGGGGGTGEDGLSAYELAVQEGFVGTIDEWLDSLQGEDGEPGPQGIPGVDGDDGLSAYEVALNNGFVGTEAEWLASLVGPPGSGDLYYVHNQVVPNATWTITHNLGKFPSASIVDSAGTVVIGDVAHVNSNQLTVTFSSAFAGKAYLN